MRQMFITPDKDVQRSSTTNASDELGNNTDMLKHIDKEVRMWLIKDNNNDNLWALSLVEGKVIDPNNQSPLNPKSKVKHLAIVSKVNNSKEEIVYGISHDDFPNFVHTVLENVTRRYPR